MLLRTKVLARKVATGHCRSFLDPAKNQTANSVRGGPSCSGWTVCLRPNKGVSPKEPQLISQLLLYCQTKDNKSLELSCTDLLVTVHMWRAVWSSLLLCFLIAFQQKGRHRLRDHDHNLCWFGKETTMSSSGGFEVQEGLSHTSCSLNWRSISSFFKRWPTSRTAWNSQANAAENLHRKWISSKRFRSHLAWDSLQGRLGHRGCDLR